MASEFKPEQVPDEVYEAWHAAFFSDAGGRAAIAAALNAWPGAYRSDPALFGEKIILPLPQETRDAE